MTKIERKIWIEFHGYEPIIRTYYKKDNYTKEGYIGLFYPLRRLKKKYYDMKLKRYFKKIGVPIKQCRGCGDGIAEWEIPIPNQDKVLIEVCNHCVDFYDINFLKRRLENKNVYLC